MESVLLILGEGGGQGIEYNIPGEGVDLSWIVSRDGVGFQKTVQDFILQHLFPSV